MGEDKGQYVKTKNVEQQLAILCKFWFINSDKHIILIVQDVKSKESLQQIMGEIPYSCSLSEASPCEVSVS